jgi:hypothetical protein
VFKFEQADSELFAMIPKHIVKGQNIKPIGDIITDNGEFNVSVIGTDGVIFVVGSSDFFKKFRPKIIIECHSILGKLTTKKCMEVLSKYGYKFQLKEQEGYPLPLLFCSPE